MLELVTEIVVGICVWERAAKMVAVVVYATVALPIV
jgi:hypothetical protein